MTADRTDIRQIKERTDIVDVISRYVTLAKAGSSHKGRCPFHKDDTPSFVVSAEKGLWHCFGCGEGGDVVAFLMKIERISFVEAAQRLAAEAGLPFATGRSEKTDALHPVMADAAALFAQNLRSKPGRKAREYLLGRGYADDAWDRFELGYAMPGWDDVKRTLSTRHGEDVLIELGLLVKGDTRTYDRFRDRTIFPILDLSGRPIAFGGRAFDGEPKYLNSPKTPLFDKGRELYGLSWARDTLAKTRSAILVEGYTDVLSLHQAGLTGAVGSMGTALTQGQAALLGRFVDEVVIAYDRDAAGGAASIRGMQILRNNGLAVRVVHMEEGDDPDTLVRREGADAVQRIINEAVPFYRFFVESLAARHDVDTVIGQEKLLDEAREFVQDMRSVPMQQKVIEELAALTRLPREGVARELSRRRSARSVEETAERKQRAWGEEEILLSLVLRGDVAWSDVVDVASTDVFSVENRPIAEALREAGEAEPIAELVERLDEESARRATYFALAPVRFNDPKRAAADALAKLVRVPALEQEIRLLNEQIRTCEAEQDWEKWGVLTRRKVALVAERVSRKGSDGTEEEHQEDR